MEFGYALSSNEHAPGDLLSYARRAEEAGFTFALLTDSAPVAAGRSSHSAFAFGALGGVAEGTGRLRVGARLTSTLIRQNPALVAQAAAMAALMMPDRFYLCVDTCEPYLVSGARMPRPAAVRPPPTIARPSSAVRMSISIWTGFKSLPGPATTTSVFVRSVPIKKVS
jgi:hypothetical protein